MTRVILHLLVVTLCLMITFQLSASAALKRSTPANCTRATPCGWLVYRPYVRTIDYYVRSPCNCSGSTRCVRTSDDISISAYVYRCRRTSESEGLEVLPAQEADDMDD